MKRLQKKLALPRRGLPPLDSRAFKSGKIPKKGSAKPPATKPVSQSFKYR